MSASSSMSWDLVNPEGAARLTSVSPAPRVADLRGKTIGLAWNGKPGGEEALEEIARLMAEQVGELHFIKFWRELPESVAARELSADVIQAMAARRPDLMVVSQAD